MRKIIPADLVRGRIRIGEYGSHDGDGLNGAFSLLYEGQLLGVIANEACAESEGWEHVSVSCQRRCPTWDEMCYVKNLFWAETELVVQFHPPKQDYVNCHPYCLHMWRNTREVISLPPTHLIGPKEDAA